MDKERLGAFIAENRRAAEMTQKDLAAQLHITDKAVSKWERGLSYPDVTLLEPLAAALALSMEELMTCRRFDPATEAEAEKNLLDEREEDMMHSILKLSHESVEKEKRQGNRRAYVLLVLAVLAVIFAVLAALHTANIVKESRQATVVLKETVDGENYVYIEEGDRLLRLRWDCEEDRRFDRILMDGRRYYKLSLRWDRRTMEGSVVACQDTGVKVPTAVGWEWNYQISGLFGFDDTSFICTNLIPDPNGDGLLGSFTFNMNVASDGEEVLRLTLLEVENCRAFASCDYDGDGKNELVVQTRWAEKPYTVYDWDARDISNEVYITKVMREEMTVTWPDTVPEEVKTLLEQQIADGFFLELAQN